MKKFGLLLIIAFLSLQGYSQEKNFIDQPYLETTAVVDTLVVPDLIYLSILITEKDTRGRTSVEELEKRMHTKLIGLEIDTKKQLTLSDVTSNFKKYFLKGKEVLKNKAYTLLVYDAETAGKVIVGLESIEISNVYLNKTEYSKLEQLKIELKQKAVLKAKTQAETMLKPLNQNIVKALYISDLNSNITHALQGSVAGIQVRGYGYYKAEEYNPIDIEFEKIKIESTVTIKFGIE
ncbi:SIMPL domain-containing protein [Olleya sp. HaHaR_3_96]|uniref:SIMPL domain-containing protein n=1 Tax=Olleya sp. HaHaR_3_96 TaxID=2745560 RepID=UPI001C773BB1|nr:SIMPL domain-containing protein [Olleya sp. HaHaR_3_96]QXP59010.1 SIMPL domain-containing protein [Olleya sp. HaHaR_3_96]